MHQTQSQVPSVLQLVTATGESPKFSPEERVRVSLRYPIGHYRVPLYIRGKRAIVESVIEPSSVNNEEEGFGRNAGSKLHYYRIGIPLLDLWPEYQGSPEDALRIEVYETWLEPLQDQTTKE